MDVIINRPDGELRLPRLSPSGVLKFKDAFRFYRKRLLLESLMMTGTTGIEAIKRLNEFDAKPLPLSAALEWVNDPEGMAEAVLLAMRVAKPEATIADLDAMGLDESQMLHAAAGVLNLQIVTTPGGQPPNPTPAGSGSIETSGETPTPSDTSSTSPTTP